MATTRGQRGFASDVFSRVKFNRSTGKLVIEGEEGTEVIPTGGAAIAVGASRDFAATDNGKILHCTTTVTLSMPSGVDGMPSGFRCRIITSGTTSIASKGTVATLNGATTTITRAAATAANKIVDVVNTSVVDDYAVTGA